MNEKTISNEMIYSGKILNLKKIEVELDNGKSSYREIVEHRGGVAIVAEIDSKILFVKQYRKSIEQDLLEIPAGKIEKDEDPLECAYRELEEETGYKAKELVLINEVYPTPGYSNEKIYVYYAKNLEKGILNPDEDEIIKNISLPLTEVNTMIKTGEINDLKTLYAIFAYQNR